MIRDLRRADGPRLFELLQVGFPEEEALLGSTPDGMARVVRRVFRWDAQFLLALARAFGRPAFRFLVVEEDGKVVATTLLTFPERTGYVSTVMVDAAYRRRGYARALLERARQIARALGRKYITLDVLDGNAPARALYERIGYRPLAGGALLVREPSAREPVDGSPALRPFRKPDAVRLAEMADRARPPEVREVLPVRASAIRGSGFVDRILESTTDAWVVDRGAGAEAHLSASVGPTAQSGHLSEPIVGDGIGESDLRALVRTAVDWCASRGYPRILARVSGWNERGRAALLGGGFREALTEQTLCRPVD
jgi:GNAT superfamily N-acetyltransferase